MKSLLTAAITCITPVFHEHDVVGTVRDPSGKAGHRESSSGCRVPTDAVRHIHPGRWWDGKNSRVRENLAAATLTDIRDKHVEGVGDLRGYCQKCGSEWPCRIRVAASSGVSDFAAAWWERRLSATSREERLRRGREPDVAGEVVDEAIESAPASTVALLCYIAEVVSPGQSPRAVGAPLEDLLASHAPRLRPPEGDKVVDAIDEAARRSPQFRDALRAVYFGDDIPSVVTARLSRFLLE